MKHTTIPFLTALLLAASSLTSNAWLKYGQVFCDANTNRLIDYGDLPVQSVLVVVTNTSGTFSNATWTSAEGAFLIALPNAPGTYVDFVLSATLPVGTTAVLPALNTFTVTNDVTVTNNFLIENLTCVIGPPVFKTGHVYCDANTNGIIDTGDLPVQSVLVAVTNLSGTFSNATWTSAEGAFLIQLPPTPDVYVDFVVAATAGGGTTAILPPFNTFSVTNGVTITNNFLIENPACVNLPPTNNGHCWLTGGGTIKSGKGKPLHSFGGVVNPGCSPTAAGGGNWNDIDFGQNLHFKGLTIEVVDCGNVPGHNGSSSPKSPFSYIEFQGVGTLKGVAGNKADYGTVQFFAHAEDLGEPGKMVDRLYLRVFDGAGNTLLLISADPANPLDIAPVTISTGNLQI